MGKTSGRTSWASSSHLMVLVGVILVLVIGPFIIWGDHFEAAFTLEGARGWMERLGPWAALGGILLLVGDIALPIPGTVVMSTLGWMYGWWIGGLLSSVGSVLSGMLAYGLCRSLGRPAARWIAGEKGLEKGHHFFESNGGGWLVALSRWTPVLPEAVACLAGLVRMPWRTFLIALACGSVPLGFAFAAIGHLGQDSPLTALGFSAVLPMVLWLVAGRFLHKKRSGK
jgi:uncharacterized membrane protein YdjX (TVP38/TMEM64 family)